MVYQNTVCHFFSKVKIMRTILSLLLLIGTSFSLIGQKLSLEDLFENDNIYTPKGIKQIHSVGDGYYTTFDKKQQLLLKRYDNINFQQLLLDSLILDGKEIAYYELSPNRKKLLFAIDKEPIYRHSYQADYFVLDLQNKKLQKLSEKGKVQQAVFSPDASKVAYVRANDLYYFDLSQQQEFRITTDGKFTEIINGLPDWVYEEESAFSRAYEWSPNSKQLAYMKFDEQAVPVYTIPFYNNDATYPRLYSYKYPKTGETNATVSVWVYDLTNRENTELDVAKTAQQYIPRISWTKGEQELLILRLNRHQNKLDYLIANTVKNTVKKVYTEVNKYFVDAINFDAITFLDKEHFAFLSEQDGYNNLYKYNYKTKKRSSWLQKKWDITTFYGIDKNGTAYLQTASKKPYNREIAKITAKGELHFLSDKEGFYDAWFDKDFTYFIECYNGVDTPPIYKIKAIENHEEYILEDNNELLTKWQEMNLPRKEFLKLPSATKSVMLSAWRILPKDFDKTKQYPVLITQYNGPNSQRVQNKFAVNWYDYLAQEGFIVYCVDTRGTAVRGEYFRKQTYMQLGKLESDDMIAVGKYLQTLPYVDANDLTIWGWSYGGFMSSLCLMKGGGVFSSAIAVAPVTHWKFYDSVYTERYMRTPKENTEGYNANSPLGNFEKLLHRHFNFLLVHGTADDNVHVQNTYALTAKMVEKDIPFDLEIYTDKNHSIYGGKTRLHLYKKFMHFLNMREIEEN